MVYCGAAWRFKVRVAPEIVLSDEEREVLDELIGSRLTSVRLALRARIVALAALGLQNKDIALALDIGRIQVSRWRERYVEFGLEGIERDLPRGAPPAKVDVARLVELTTQSKPEAATHGSTRTMAEQLGVSAASVSRHWRANGLKPHLVRGFKVSRDPKFIDKLEDIAGLYMSPPEHALVRCCDEKSQVQALDPHAARSADEEGPSGHDDPRSRAPATSCRRSFAPTTA
jgi:transposase